MILSPVTPVTMTGKRAHLAHENQSEVIVGHLAGGAQREVRGDKSARAGELTFAALDAPHHRESLPTLGRWSAAPNHIPADS